MTATDVFDMLRKNKHIQVYMEYIEVVRLMEHDWLSFFVFHNNAALSIIVLYFEMLKDFVFR